MTEYWNQYMLGNKAKRKDTFCSMYVESKVIIRKLIDLLQQREWSIRNAAENRFCDSCVTDDERWTDQKDHHGGCEFVDTILKAEKFINEA